MILYCSINTARNVYYIDNCCSGWLLSLWFLFSCRAAQTIFVSTIGCDIYRLANTESSCHKDRVLSGTLYLSKVIINDGCALSVGVIATWISYHVAVTEAWECVTMAADGTIWCNWWLDNAACLKWAVVFAVERWAVWPLSDAFLCERDERSARHGHGTKMNPFTAICEGTVVQRQP